MEDWEPVSLGDLIDIKHGYAFKGAYFRDTPPGDILLTPGNFAIGGGFQFSKLKYYDGPAVPGFVLTAGDLLVTMTDLSKAGDTLGYPAIVPADSNAYLHNQRLGKVVIKNQDVSRDFIYWLLRTRDYRHEILSSCTGSTVRHTSPRRIQAFKFLLPPRDERERIAEALNCLDDKIELNRRINETLEAMAQAIFRDWFVEFGPTRRKMEGETDPVAILGNLTPNPGKAATLARLFPASLAANGLPEGWEPTRLDQLLELAYGKALTKKDRSEGEYPVYGSGGIDGTHNQALVEGPGIIIGRKGTVGSLHWEDSDFFPIDTVFYVKAKVPLSFAYYLLKTLGLEHMDTDAAVPGLNRSNVYRLEPVVGCDRTRDAFSDIIDVFRFKIAQSLTECKTLAATRDLLLPKLISGEIRLRDAEAVA